MHINIIGLTYLLYSLHFGKIENSEIKDNDTGQTGTKIEKGHMKPPLNTKKIHCT